MLVNLPSKLAQSKKDVSLTVPGYATCTKRRQIQEVHNPRVSLKTSPWYCQPYCSLLLKKQFLASLLFFLFSYFSSWCAASLAAGMPDALLGRALESVVQLLKQSEGNKGDGVLRSNIQTIAALRYPRRTSTVLYCTVLYGT